MLRAANERVLQLIKRGVLCIGVEWESKTGFVDRWLLILAMMDSERNSDEYLEHDLKALGFLTKRNKNFAIEIK